MSELITTSQITDIAQNGAEVLSTNKERSEKALAVGRNILQAINAAGGLNPELDARCNKYLVNCRTAKKEMEEARKPITQLFDQIKKEFTATENELDIRKSGTVPFIVQNHRNEYVKQIEAEREKKRLEQELELNKQKERVDIATSVKTQLSAHVQDYIEKTKADLEKSFNSITLEDFDVRSKKLKAYAPSYTLSHFKAFKPVLFPKHLTAEAVKAITQEVIDSKDFDVIAGVVEGDINAFVRELIEKLPSLKNELERIATANAEEKKALEEARAKREAEEKAKREADAAEAQRKKEEELKLQAEGEKADAIMDNLELFDDKGPETRSGYNISILHQAGAVEIFQFWFEREGAKCTIEELERKSIGQMKTFCERAAHKDGEMISSKYLKYEAVYKAVNRK